MPHGGAHSEPPSPARADEPPMYQAAGNLVLTNHMAFPGVLVVSREWWGKLNARQQTLVRESAQRSIQWGHQQVAQLEKAAAQADKAEATTRKAHEQALQSQAALHAALANKKLELQEQASRLAPPAPKVEWLSLDCPAPAASQ